MKVIQVKNPEEGGKVAFEILKEKLANGAQTLGLATGSSPLEFYREIVGKSISIRICKYFRIGISKRSKSIHHFSPAKTLALVQEQ